MQDGHRRAGDRFPLFVGDEAVHGGRRDSLPERGPGKGDAQSEQTAQQSIDRGG